MGEGGSLIDNVHDAVGDKNVDCDNASAVHKYVIVVTKSDGQAFSVERLELSPVL